MTTMKRAFVDLFRKSEEDVRALFELVESAGGRVEELYGSPEVERAVVLSAPNGLIARLEEEGHPGFISFYTGEVPGDYLLLDDSVRAAADHWNREVSGGQFGYQAQE